MVGGRGQVWVDTSLECLDISDCREDDGVGRGDDVAGEDREVFAESRKSENFDLMASISLVRESSFDNTNLS